MADSQRLEIFLSALSMYLVITLDVLRLLCQCFALICVAMFKYVVPESPKSVINQVILITGSANGLGRHLALKFAKLGAKIILWDIDKEANIQVEKEIRSFGAEAWAYHVDVSDEKNVEKAARDVFKDIGNVQYLINNAAILSGKPLLELNTTDMRRTLEVNTMGHFWLIKQFLPPMLEAGEGHIVTVASIAGMIGCANLTDYCASKHGVIGFMSALREDLYNMGKEDDIQITVVCPPTMLTRLVRNPKTRFPSLYPLYKPETIADMIVDGVRRNKKTVIPFAFMLTAKLSSLFPSDIIRTVQRFCDYTIAPN